MSVEAGQVKLMKPLFIDGMFNREGKRIRAKYIKTISCEGAVYPLWINSGKPDKDYTKNPDDQYYLYIQVGDFIVMTGYTEYDLETRSGSDRLNKEWYGDFEGREKYFKENIYKGRTFEEYEPLIKEQIVKENTFIAEYGKHEATQAAFLKQDIDRAIARYIDARDNNGKFADFVGAAFVGELGTCDKLSQKLKKIRQQEENIKRAEREEQHKKDVEEEQKKNRPQLKKRKTRLSMVVQLKMAHWLLRLRINMGLMFLFVPEDGY